MVVLNDSTESLSTAVWGRRFQSTVVRGKYEAFLCCVLHSGTWYNRECKFLECLKGGESLSLLLTATLSWEILNIMTGRASLRRSSRLRHLRCYRMSPTLDVLRCLLVTYLAALRWTISILLQNSDGLTNDLYACSLTEVEPMFRLRCRKPKVLLALPQMLLMWLSHKGETIHRMYRNRDYFGDGSVHDTWRPITIQTIWCSFFEKK